MQTYIKSLLTLAGLPKGMQVAVYVLLGLAVGAAGLFFHASRAMSYLNKERGPIVTR